MSSYPGFMSGPPMADLRLQRRMEQLEGDREALEHIARALEGRVLPLPAMPDIDRPTDEIWELALGAQGLKVLLEAGGLAAILPNGAAASVVENGSDRSEAVDALTRSRRRLKVAFASCVLD